MMYVKNAADQQKIFQEAFRVLKPGACFYLWEVDLAERPITDKEIYAVHLQYRVREEEIETGYGQKWPAEARGEAHYLSLAREAGFQHLSTVRNGSTFHMVFQKM